MESSRHGHEKKTNSNAAPCCEINSNKKAQHFYRFSVVASVFISIYSLHKCYNVNNLLLERNMTYCISMLDLNTYQTEVAYITMKQMFTL